MFKSGTCQVANGPLLQFSMVGRCFLDIYLMRYAGHAGLKTVEHIVENLEMLPRLIRTSLPL